MATKKIKNERLKIIVTKKEPVTELFTAEDMLKFASWFTDYGEEINTDRLRDYIKHRNRERAIEEFTKEYDKKHK